MVWILETTNLTKDINLSNIPGLNLVSTKADIKSTLSTVDPQAQYYLEKKIDFEPISNIPIPIPTISYLYVIDSLADITTSREVYNINFLEENSYYKDYVEEKTYILSENNATVESSLLLDFDAFEENNFNYTYVFDNPVNFSIDTILVDGLIYLPGINDPHTFSLNNSTDLNVIAAKNCGPQSEDLFELKISSFLDSYADEIFEVYKFDFSNEDIDYIDSLDYNNQTFQATSVISTNTLLFNRRINLAICLR